MKRLTASLFAISTVLAVASTAHAQFVNENYFMHQAQIEHDAALAQQVEYGRHYRSPYQHCVDEHVQRPYRWSYEHAAWFCRRLPR